MMTYVTLLCKAELPYQSFNTISHRVLRCILVSKLPNTHTPRVTLTPASKIPVSMLHNARAPSICLTLPKSSLSHTPRLLCASIIAPNSPCHSTYANRPNAHVHPTSSHTPSPYNIPPAGDQEAACNVLEYDQLHLHSIKET